MWSHPRHRNQPPCPAPLLLLPSAAAPCPSQHGWAEGEPVLEQEQLSRKPRSLQSLSLWRIRVESTSHYQEQSMGATAQGWQPATGRRTPPLLGMFLPVCKMGWILHLHSFSKVNYDPQAHVMKERFPSLRSHQARIAA